MSKQARVNSGQVYHYFGSKSALLQAAMRRLLDEHREQLSRTASIGFPWSDRYWRALAHAVLDGADDLFAIELNPSDGSIPLAYIASRRAAVGGPLDAEEAAQALANLALALGWVTFEPFLLALIRQYPDHPSRDALRQAILEMLEKLFEGPPRA